MVNQRKELVIIGELLDINEGYFQSFIESTQKLLDKSFSTTKNNDLDVEAIKSIFVNLHTIKGTARSHSLSYLTPFVHDGEQFLSDILKHKGIIDKDHITRDLNSIQESLNEYFDLFSGKLGRNFSSSLPGDFAHRLLTALESSSSHEVPRLRSFLLDNIYQNLDTILNEVSHSLERLAESLGKNPPQLVINSSLSLDHQYAKLIKHISTHLIQNSMDHGIETTEERLKKNKPASGSMYYDFWVEENILNITFRDDGNGLNLNKIKSKAVAIEIIERDSELSMIEMANLIFHPGFSTKQSVSEISGRGIGLQAVKSMVEEHKGIIEICLDHQTSEQVTPFYFKIIIPLRSENFIILDQVA